MVLAYGVAALRAGSLARPVAVVAVCAIIGALAAPVMHKPGLLITRSADPAYGVAQQMISKDPQFSRVLWLPQRSRWVTGSALHPVANAPWLGVYDWNSFRWQRGFDDDVINYAYTPLFSQLLRWGAFRYVVLDCSTEVDATIRTDSFSCSKLAIELRRPELRPIMVAGPLTVYRMTGSLAPALWSTRRAVLANGPPLSLNAGALLHVFDKIFPDILSGDTKRTAPLTRQVLFDGGRSNAPAAPVERIVGADAVDFGPNAGDAVINGRALEAMELRLRGRADGSSTVSFDGTLAETIPQFVGHLKEIAPASILARGTDRTVMRPSYWTVGTEVSGFAIPIYEKPALRIVTSRIMSEGLFATLFELRDRPAGRRYVLVGPTFQGRAPPLAEIDIRDWLFRTVVENPRYDAVLGRNDGFDRLELVRVRLVRVGMSTNPEQKISLAVRALNSTAGYPVRSVRLADAARYSCACARRTMGASQRLVLRAPGERRTGWMRGIVAIHARPASYTGIISTITRDLISGTTIVAGQPFSVRRSQVSAINPAPDAALIDLHLSSPAAGVLLLRGAVTPTVTLQLFLHGYMAGRNAWVAADIPYASVGRQRPFTVRMDLLAAVRRAGYDRIGDVMVLLKYRDPRERRPAVIDLTDAAVVSDRPGPSPKASLRVVKNQVNTTLAAGQVPLAVRFSDGTRVSDSQHILQVVPSAITRFSSHTGDRWLVFSEAFNPAWILVDQKGAPINATHLRAFGTLNAWYVPEGLHGSYQIIYTADALARAGAAIALAAVCAALALVLWPFAAGKRPGQSEK